MLLDKEMLGWLSIILVIASILPYYLMIFRGQVKPHAFSWAIWTIVLGIGFAAGHSKMAGAGVWSTAVACFNCLCVTIIAFFKGHHSYTRSDVASLAAALAAIPLWYVTNNPLGAVIIITLIDGLAFYPTMRKSYHKPYEESIFVFLTGGLNYAIALLAIEHWETATWLYPASMAFTCLALVGLIAIRRRTLHDSVA